MSADVLREAAAQMRDRFSREDADDPNEAEFYLAVADWLEAEAAKYKELVAQSFAVNILLATADEPVDARVSLGYHTLNEALAVARAYLGGAS